MINLGSGFYCSLLFDTSVGTTNAVQVVNEPPATTSTSGAGYGFAVSDFLSNSDSWDFVVYVGTEFDDGSVETVG